MAKSLEGLASVRPRQGAAARTSKDLAVQLARLAVEMRRRARAALALDGGLRRLYEAFRATLMCDLDGDGFADAYAQTVSYGLLSASIARQGGAHAAESLKVVLANINPLLRELMQTFFATDGRVGRAGFDDSSVGEVLKLLRRTRMEEVLQDFGARHPEEDPVTHFYELFLKEYDPEKRAQRGVFYTPRPVVRFVVRSVDEVLRTEFGLEDGLADTTTWGEFVARRKLRDPQFEISVPEGVGAQEPFVQILDPATGTGTFLVEVVDRIHRTMRAKWTRHGKAEEEMRELWNEYVPRHLLPRLHGFELMLTPYAVAHLKLGLKLMETKYRFVSTERARIYLTNALAEREDFSGDFKQTAPAREAEAASRVKRSTPFTVVLGNPPYSYMSADLSERARSLVEPYRYVDGERIKEKGAIVLERALQDDYVKFFAVAQRALAARRFGVLGYVSNSAFLHNPNLRGMRHSLLLSSDRIAVLDLHGDTKRDGRDDQNVFEIKTGVAVTLARWLGGSDGLAAVRRADLSGSREHKHARLLRDESPLASARVVVPAPGDYLFTESCAGAREYLEWISVNDAFNVTSVGMKTNRDRLVIDFEDGPILERLKVFTDTRLTTEEIKAALGVSDNAQWSVDRARRECRATFDPENLKDLAYRPFDRRRIYYHRSVVFNARPGTMRHMLGGGNLALLVNRRIRTGRHAHFFVTRLLSMAEMLSSADNCNVYPLYLKNVVPDATHTTHALSDALVRAAARKLGLTFKSAGRGDLVSDFGPEDLLHFVYAVFHSPSYRVRYADFLRADYPRFPVTSDAGLFRELCAHGADLVALHLLEDEYEAASWNSSQTERESPLETSPARFVGEGHAEVGKGYPQYVDGRVCVNASSHFEGVAEEVWRFHVGGHQVCAKWLKDRRGRALSDEDLKHYRRVVAALEETLSVMSKIDCAVEEHGGWPRAGSHPATETRLRDGPCSA